VDLWKAQSEPPWISSPLQLGTTATTLCWATASNRRAQSVNMLFHRSSSSSVSSIRLLLLLHHLVSLFRSSHIVSHLVSHSFSLLAPTFSVYNNQRRLTGSRQGRFTDIITYTLVAYPRHLVIIIVTGTVMHVSPGNGDNQRRNFTTGRHTDCYCSLVRLCPLAYIYII
jgi:hypothetical protein